MLSTGGPPAAFDFRAALGACVQRQLHGRSVEKAAASLRSAGNKLSIRYAGNTAAQNATAADSREAGAACAAGQAEGQTFLHDFLGLFEPALLAWSVLLLRSLLFLQQSVNMVTDEQQGYRTGQALALCFLSFLPLGASAENQKRALVVSGAAIIVFHQQHFTWGLI